MDRKIDSQKTLEVIERLKLAKIGAYEKWEVIIKKIKKDIPLNPGELEYYANLTRIYKDSNISSRTGSIIQSSQSTMKNYLVNNAEKILNTIAT